MSVVNNTVSGNVATNTNTGPVVSFADENAAKFYDINNGNYVLDPYGNTYRGIFGSWFNKGDIAQEDFIRDQQAKMNDHVLNKEILKLGNEFTAAENQKQRDFEKELASTSYQRAVEDLKRAGLNPILAYSNGGADSPAFGVSTQSSTPNSRSGYASSSGGSAEGSLLKTIVDIIGLFYGKTNKIKKI